MLRYWGLTLLRHWKKGGGFPVALHSRLTGEPFLASTKPPPETSRICGGTEIKK